MKSSFFLPAGAIGMALACLPLARAAPADQPPRSDAGFEGTTLPAPPAQGRPWAAPRTRLPSFLIDATAILFDQGMPDPRRCEYRAIEIGVGTGPGPGFGAGKGRPRGGLGVATHGWVLPAPA